MKPINKNAQRIALYLVAVLILAAGDFFLDMLVRELGLPHTVHVAVIIAILVFPAIIFARRDNRLRELIVEMADAHTKMKELYRKADLYGKRLGILLGVSHRLHSYLHMKNLFETVLDGCLSDVGPDASAIFIQAGEGETLEPAAYCGFPPGAGKGLVMKVGENIPGRAFAEGRVVTAENLPADSRLTNRFIRGLNPQTVIAVPLVCRGKKTGVLVLWTFDAHHYEEEEKKVLQIAADQIAMAIDNARLFEEKRRMATTDSMTSLANHRTFYKTLESEMERARRYNHPLSLLMIDVDDFKQFNDTFGHIQGDKVLIEVGQILNGVVRSIDMAARYGGEEFTVILPETAYMATGERQGLALEVAERIREAVAAHLFEGEPERRTVKVTVSVGVAEFPTCSQSLRELVQAADGALYRAKKKGKDCVVAAAPDSDSALGSEADKKAS